MEDKVTMYEVIPLPSDYQEGIVWLTPSMMQRSKLMTQAEYDEYMAKVTDGTKHYLIKS